MNKVIRNGNVAVLVSYGFGAGWYSWNSSICGEECLFDPDIVSLVEQMKNASDKERSKIIKEIQSLAEEKWEGFYTGGADGLDIKWLDEGTPFIINEYDGAESVETFDTSNYPIRA